MANLADTKFKHPKEILKADRELTVNGSKFRVIKLEENGAGFTAKQTSGDFDPPVGFRFALNHYWMEVTENKNSIIKFIYKRN